MNAIPIFKDKTVPVYEMEQYLNGSTEEAKQFKRILTAVKEYKCFLSVEDVSSLLEYKEKAELEVFSILVNIGRMPNTDYDYYSLKEEFDSIEEYKTYKPNSVKEMKYYAVKQIIKELDLIHAILMEGIHLNYVPESVIVANINELQEQLDDHKK